jgi:glycosyltransferase involved in cell wall biosynthesis
VPVVTMIGDYNWYCPRTFLVDSWLNRCSGPESGEKCFRCLNNDLSGKRQILNVVLKHADALPSILRPRGMVDSDLWLAVCESRKYLSALRAGIHRFIVGDRQAAVFLRAHGVDGERLVHIEQCLPEDALQKRPRISQEHSSSDRALSFCFVGRFDSDKGLHVLANAFEQLPPECNAELWIVHRTAATAANVARFFKNKAWLDRALEVGRIKLRRPETPEELYSTMAAADVGIIPSIQYESPSLAMLEFVAQGTPIVRSDSPGMEHVIQDGINGRTFPYGDWHALRAILLEIVRDPRLLDAWRLHLPSIGNDARYARSLKELFENAPRSRERDEIDE